VLDQQLVPARPAHAFGGSKQSGIGREGGVHSLEFYTELRNVMAEVLVDPRTTIAGQVHDAI
jgi:acyl-CoA reductase-like NAD-dependent aldehyde dehydrogenase